MRTDGRTKPNSVAKRLRSVFTLVVSGPFLLRISGTRWLPTSTFTSSTFSMSSTDSSGAAGGALRLSSSLASAAARALRRGAYQPSTAKADPMARKGAIGRPGVTASANSSPAATINAFG